MGGKDAIHYSPTLTTLAIRPSFFRRVIDSVYREITAQIIVSIIDGEMVNALKHSPDPDSEEG